MRRSVFVLPLAIAFLSIPAVCLAQDQPPDLTNPTRNLTVQATVLIARTQTYIERVRVELSAYAGESLGVTFTDGSGRFEFRNLRPGTYTLTLSAPGYEGVQESLDLNSGSRRDMEIYLKPSTKSGSVAAASTISAHELSLPVKARDAMQAGMQKLYGKKDAQGSLTDFAHAISVAPGYYEAYLQRGLAQMQLGKAAEAEQDLRKSIELSEDRFIPAELTLGGLLLDLVRPAEAEKPLRRAAELEPKNWLTQYELGRALLGQGRFAEALQYADRARQQKPDSPLVYRLLVNIHARQNNQTALLEDLNNYIRLDPDSPPGLRAKKMREDVERSLAQGQASTTAQPALKP